MSNVRNSKAARTADNTSYNGKSSLDKDETDGALPIDEGMLGTMTHFEMGGEMHYKELQLCRCCIGNLIC